MEQFDIWGNKLIHCPCQELDEKIDTTPTAHVRQI